MLISSNFFYSYIHGVCPLFETIEIFKEIKNLNMLIDVGSNKGQFSILFKYYFPKQNYFTETKEFLKIQKKILWIILNSIICLGDKNEISYLNITKKKR